MKALQVGYYNSPLSWIEIKADQDTIVSVSFIDSPGRDKSLECATAVLKQCIIELDEYFNGERRLFTIDTYQEGTVFQQKVWKELSKIPFGKTVSYAAIAQRCGSASAVRAVGSANSRNKIAIIIPCHRVIGSNGKLTGYAGGMDRKEWLIRHEKKQPLYKQLTIL